VSFAPTDERQVRLWRRLMARHDTVSWERVVSGPGLVGVYEFARDEEGAADPPGVAAARGTDGHGPAIVAAAVADPASIAGRALEFFTELWGAEAGNVALSLLATGGLYLGGGLAGPLLPWLERPAFREAFLAKGRMRPLLEPIPVHVIRDARTALLGALLHARRHLVP
jgi:glucokinase